MLFPAGAGMNRREVNLWKTLRPQTRGLCPLREGDGVTLPRDEQT